MRLMALSPPQVGNIFPNLAVLFLYAPGRDYTFVGALAVHTFVPRGPETFEFYTWFFAEKDVSEEKKRALRAAGIYNEIGRSSCRERVCQYVSFSVVAVSFKKKNTSTIT